MAKKVLEGIRVLEFSQAIAGPQLGKYLAYHGAEVIMVESRMKLGPFRIYFSGRFPELGLRELSPHTANLSGGKLGLALEMSKPEGQKIFERLVKMSDVVICNFSVRGMNSLGLDYERLKGINPKIIVVLMPGFGMTGPHRDYLCYGPNIESMTGIKHVTGWPGGGPAGTGVSYPDYISAWHGVIAVLSALFHRRRTGEGQLIDLSLQEAAVSLIGPIVMDYMVNGRNQGPWGNRLPYAAPHGAFRCRGYDRWVAIAVFSDEEWEAFCEAIGRPAWTADPKFATLPDRLANVGELEPLVEEWTSQRDAYEVMFTLQRAGVAAGVLQMTEDIIYRDRHLAARQFLLLLEHPFFGRHLVDGVTARLTKTPGGFDRVGPIVGQDNDYVCGQLLGMSQEEIERLAEEGVIYPPQWEEQGKDMEKVNQEDVLPTIMGEITRKVVVASKLV